MNTKEPTFANLLVTYRRTLGLSQQDVAELGGIHPSDYSKIERLIKPAPRVEVILKWASGFKLSRQQTREFITAAGYSTSILEQIKFDPSRYPIATESVEEHLKGSYGLWPVWHVDEAGTVVAANLLAFRLWGALRENEETIHAERLLGASVYEVMARPENISRIAMPEKSSDFWYTMLGVWNKLKEEVPLSIVTTFENVIEPHPILGLILRYGSVNFEHEWEYDLRIYPSSPSLHTEPKLYLEFKILTKRVLKEGKHIGYLVTAQPIRSFTMEYTEREYARLTATHMPGTFVQREPDTHIMEEEEKYPPFFPALHLDLLWNITFENTEFELLINDKKEEFKGKHYFDMLFSPRVLPHMDRFSRQNLLIPVRQFIKQTKDYSHERSPYKQQYALLMAHLLEHVNFQGLLAELGQSLPVSENPTPLKEGIPSFRMDMACPLTDKVKLAFSVVARPPSESERDYRVTFVPTTNATKAALILIRLQDIMQKQEPDSSLIGTSKYEQLIWLLTTLKTLREGFTKKKGKADWDWQVEAAFKQEHKNLMHETKDTETVQHHITWTLTQVLLDDEERQTGILDMLRTFTEPAPYAHAFLATPVTDAKELPSLT